MKNKVKIISGNLFGILTILSGISCVVLETKGMSHASPYVASAFGAFFIALGTLILIWVNQSSFRKIL